MLDLSTFTREEAARLLSTSEPPCVRFVLREGRPVFREALRTAAMVTVLAGAAQAGVRIAIDPPALVEKLEAAVRPGPPTMTGGVIVRNQEWH
ncbi:MAG: hypothetical protein LC689_00480 [Myxococcales bacterium]|nr:hypothetical protein [Myxococcales bacterium]